MNTTSDFEAFFKDNYSDMVNYAFCFVKDFEVSKDIVSSSFEFLWENRNKYDDKRSYLCWVVRNKSLDYLRHLSVENKYAQLYIKSQDWTQYENFDETEKRIRMVLESIPELSERTQMIITECFLKRKKYKQVAEENNITVAAVKKHVSKALAFFRSKFVKK